MMDIAEATRRTNPVPLRFVEPNGGDLPTPVMWRGMGQPPSAGANG